MIKKILTISGMVSIFTFLLTGCLCYQQLTKYRVESNFNNNTDDTIKFSKRSGRWL